MKKRKVAIFDIDGTIFRSSLLIELVDALIMEGVFPSKTRKFYVRAHKDWLDRKDSYEKYIGAVIRASDRNIKGVSRKDFLRVARKVVAFHKNRVYRYTRDLIRDLRKKKYYLLAISHSPKYIVEEFAKHLGFDKVYGRLMEIDDSGRFTGKFLHLDLIKDKAKVVRRAVLKENLTLKDSVGVGDTESDVSFLNLVDRPICFNPNSILYARAKRKGWEVVVERKDVIYKLE
ncbi:MAG: HAD-IB family hydrolase [Patescibacteria group bacterium]